MKSQPTEKISRRAVRTFFGRPESKRESELLILLAKYHAAFPSFDPDALKKFKSEKFLYAKAFALEDVQLMNELFKTLSEKAPNIMEMKTEMPGIIRKLLEFKSELGALCARFAKKFAAVERRLEALQSATAQKLNFTISLALGAFAGWFLSPVQMLFQSMPLQSTAILDCAIGGIAGAVLGLALYGLAYSYNKHLFRLGMPFKAIADYLIGEKQPPT